MLILAPPVHVSQSRTGNKPRPAAKVRAKRKRTRSLVRLPHRPNRRFACNASLAGLSKLNICKRSSEPFVDFKMLIGNKTLAQILDEMRPCLPGEVCPTGGAA